MLVKSLHKADDLDLVDHYRYVKSAGKRTKEEEQVEMKLGFVKKIKQGASKKDMTPLERIGEIGDFTYCHPNFTQGHYSVSR